MITIRGVEKGTAQGFEWGMSAAERLFEEGNKGETNWRIIRSDRWWYSLMQCS